MMVVHTQCKLAHDKPSAFSQLEVVALALAQYMAPFTRFLPILMEWMC
jgi:hypothetical protein